MLIIRKLLYFFDRRDRLRAGLLVFMMFVGALFEALGIGLILPFIAFVNDPQLILEKPLSARIYNFTGAGSPQQFLLWCGLGLGLLYVIKNLYIGLLYYSLYRFIFNRQVALARRLLAAYMHSPYTFYLQRNSSELLRNVNLEIPVSISNLMIATFLCASETTVIVVLLCLLVAVQPAGALITIGVLGGFSTYFYRAMRRRTAEFGKKQQELSALMIKSVNQGLGGFKETKVLGREEFFIDAHHASSIGYAKTMRYLNVSNEMPRLVNEVVAILAMLSIIIVFLLRGQDMRAVMPVLSLFALSAMRLMPSMSRIIVALNRIRFFSPSVEVVFKDLQDLKLLPGQAVAEPAKAGAIVANPNGAPPEPLVFRNAIEMRDVSFRYDGSQKYALKQVNLSIPRGHSVAFVGSSGAGKTTIADVILGLLKPLEGEVVVDGVDIQRNLAGWQRKIGYIPQPIYLSDDTIRRNIGFGLADEKIDDDRVWAAIQAAQLEELVRSLPEQLDAWVGERGVRISGGQRQRVGIARALYHDPEVLVMDEATSALDNETESEITKAIAQFNRQKTIIIIAHRLTTVKNSDRLFFMKNGELVDQGNFDALLQTNSDFQNMVRAM